MTNITMSPMTDFLLATISATLAVGWLQHVTSMHPVIAVILWSAIQAIAIWYWWFTSP
jgi:hypothetical protein